MRTRIVILACLLCAIAMLAAPEPASALWCYRCSFVVDCDENGCVVFEVCKNVQGGNAEDCWIDQFGTCRDSGSFCLIA